MEVRVLFEGTLDKCTYEHGKKDWKRRHFVFKHILASNIRSLEFYASGTKNWKKTEPKGVLALYPGYEVVKVHDPKKHFVFEIKTVDHTFRLAAHSEDELNQWILVLERESVVNSFLVEPEANDQLEKVGASDSCHLHVANNELRLLCAKDGRLLVAWPLTCLRRYMSSQGKFTIEAGRRAPTGAGKFTFLSPQHDEIYKLLDNVVRSRAGNKGGPSKPHSSPQKAKDEDVSHNGYDQLLATSPAKNQQMSTKSSNSLKSVYAAPYGHLPSREAINTGLPFIVVPRNTSSLESEKDGRYNTLNHCAPGYAEPIRKQDLKATDDEYCTLHHHLSSVTDKQNVYNVLHQRGRPQPMTGSQYERKQTEGVYNVLGEKPHTALTGHSSPSELAACNTLSITSSSQSQVPTLARRGEETYDTLEHSSSPRPPHKPILPPTRPNPYVKPTQVDSHVQPAEKTPPRPLAKKPSGQLNKEETTQSSSAQEGDEMYNTLDTKERPTQSPVKKVHEQRTAFQKSKSVSLDDDRDAQLSKQRPPPPPPPYRTTSEQLIMLQKFQADSDENNLYNTLDGRTVRHSPVAVRRLFKESTDEDGEIYNTLGGATRIGSSPNPGLRLSESDELYNKLDSTRVGPTSHPRQFTDENADGMYNRLDKSRIELSSSVPALAQRLLPSHGTNAKISLNSPGEEGAPPLFRRNSSSSVNSVGDPLGMAVSQIEDPHRTSSLDDLDSHASIGPSLSSSQNTGNKQLPIPAQRTLNSKGLPSKARKASAPGVVSLATTHSGKDARKGGKNRLVLNLKASLEAGGLDFSKPRRKPRKLSREDSGDLPRYAETDEHTVSTPSSAEEVSLPGTPPVTAGRSCSSPLNSSQGEDICDDASPGHKSQEITKAKKTPKK